MRLECTTVHTPIVIETILSKMTPIVKFTLRQGLFDSDIIVAEKECFGKVHFPSIKEEKHANMGVLEEQNLKP